MHPKKLKIKLVRPKLVENVTYQPSSFTAVDIINWIRSTYKLFEPDYLDNRLTF
jgi:hypothetical protein